MIQAAPSTSFEAVAQFATGLAGTLGVRLDQAGTTITPRTTTGITEFPAASGVYHVTLTSPATEGQYQVVWDDTANYAAEDLVVGFSLLIGGTGPTYVTLAEFKATLGITTTKSDADVTASLNAASRAIDNLCQRRFYLDADAAQVRYYSPVQPMRLDTDDIAVLTSLESQDDGTTTFANTWVLDTDFFLEPLNAPLSTEAWPYTSLRVHPLGAFVFNTFFPRSVKVTGQFGWPAVPSPIADATMLLAERLFKMKREAPMGILQFQQEAVRIARADSNLMINIGPYMRYRASVA